MSEPDVVAGLDGFLSQWEALGHSNSTLADLTRRARDEILALRAQQEAVRGIAGNERRLSEAIIQQARAEALEEAARLHEQINPACDHERLEGHPGAGAMGAVIKYRDAIRALKRERS